MPQCTAKSKRSQLPCQLAAMHGSTVCYMHGGASLKGLASQSLKAGGKYSKYLSLRMGAHYNEALTDGDLHSLRHEIGVLEARVRELLTRSETSDLGHAWLDLSKAWQAFMDAQARRDVGAMGEALPVVERQIARGVQDYLLWSTLESSLKTLASLRYQEHKRLIDLQAVITEERALVIFGQIQLALREAVLQHADKEQAATILTATQQALRRFDLELIPGRRLPES